MRYISCAILVAALAGCGDEARIAQPPEVPASLKPAASYDIVKLPSLGGTSRGMAINNEAMVAGWSLTGAGLRHAARWIDGSILDLGTLGGPNSTVPWPEAVKEHMVAAIV